MRLLRHFFALAAGFAAMEVLVFVAGFLAARNMPRGYFKYFGRENQEAALALWSGVAFALPMFVSATFMAWVMGRAIKISNKAIFVLFTVGAAGSFAIYLASAALANTSDSSLPSALWQQLTMYWPQAYWQLPSGPWAGWLGLAFGLYLSTRGHHAQRTEA